jgi:hypothetical protein
MILYEHPLSSCAQKVKIALREKGLAFEARLGSGRRDIALAVIGAAAPLQRRIRRRARARAWRP